MLEDARTLIAPEEMHVAFLRDKLAIYEDLVGLLLERGYELKNAFACAINNGFVPRPQWPERSLQGGDKIDVVTPITGG